MVMDAPLVPFRPPKIFAVEFLRLFFAFWPFASIEQASAFPTRNLLECKADKFVREFISQAAKKGREKERFNEQEYFFSFLRYISASTGDDRLDFACIVRPAIAISFIIQCRAITVDRRVNNFFVHFSISFSFSKT